MWRRGLTSHTLRLFAAGAEPRALRPVADGQRLGFASAAGSGGGAPPGGEPDIHKPSSQPLEDPHTRAADFHRFADIYLGGLWNRFEAGLRETEGEEYEYNVELTAGCMRVSLPDSAQIVICKDPGARALVVDSNLHDLSGGGDPRDEAAFRLDEAEGGFLDGGVALHEYLEDHLAKHLKVQLDLDPTGNAGAPDKTYGPDPT